MKLLRFIRNIWNSIFDIIFDEDSKAFIQGMVGSFLFFAMGVAAILSLGILGEWIGLEKQIMPSDRQSDIFSLGIVMFVGILFGMFICFFIWEIIKKLKEIWKNS